MNIMWRKRDRYKHIDRKGDIFGVSNALVKQLKLDLTKPPDAQSPSDGGRNWILVEATSSRKPVVVRDSKPSEAKLRNINRLNEKILHKLNEQQSAGSVTETMRAGARLVDESFRFIQDEDNRQATLTSMNEPEMRWDINTYSRPLTLRPTSPQRNHLSTASTDYLGESDEPRLVRTVRQDNFYDNSRGDVTDSASTSRNLLLRDLRNDSRLRRDPRWNTGHDRRQQMHLNTYGRKRNNIPRRPSNMTLQRYHLPRKYGTIRRDEIEITPHDTYRREGKYPRYQNYDSEATWRHPPQRFHCDFCAFRIFRPGDFCPVCLRGAVRSLGLPYYTPDQILNAGHLPHEWSMYPTLPQNYNTFGYGKTGPQPFLFTTGTRRPVRPSPKKPVYRYGAPLSESLYDYEVFARRKKRKQTIRKGAALALALLALALVLAAGVVLAAVQN